MIEIDSLKNINCQLHPQSFLQFVCLEQGCQQNTLCELCITEHPHQKFMAARMLNQLLQKLDTKKLYETLNIYNQSKMEYLSNFKEFILKLQICYDKLVRQESDDENALKLFQTELKIGGASDIITYIKKLSKIVEYKQGKLELKDIKIPTFYGSIDDLKINIDSIFNDHFIATLKNQKISITPTSEIYQTQSSQLILATEPNVRSTSDQQQSLTPTEQKPKILILNKTNYKSESQDFNVQKIESFVFQVDNTDIQIDNKGKRAEIKQTLSKDRYNKLVYLSPNLNLAGSATVKFMYSQNGYSACHVKFGIYACEFGKTKYPSTIYSQFNDTTGFSFFQDQPQNTYCIKFNKAQLTLELFDSSHLLESKQILEQPQKQYIFCFILQPGSKIELLG